SEDAAALVAQADALARDGQARRARSLYEDALRRHPDDATAANALHGLLRLRVAPDGALRDYRSAQVLADRLVAEYPDSPQADDARAWRAVLRQVGQCDAGLARARDDLERVKAADVQLERRR